MKELSFEPDLNDHFVKQLFNIGGWDKTLAVNTGTRGARLVYSLLNGATFVRIDERAVRLQVEEDAAEKLKLLSRSCIAEVHCVAEWLETGKVPVRRIAKLALGHRNRAAQCDCGPLTPEATIDQIANIGSQFGLTLDDDSRKRVSAVVVAGLVR
jgi:hypothetical protein